MAFKQLHLEYCASILVRLLSGLSNKLEFTDAFSIKTVINLPKSSPYSGDHHRYTQALIPLYKYLFNIGPKYIKKMFSLGCNNYDLRGNCKLNLP